jgi:hypothetical protein
MSVTEPQGPAFQMTRKDTVKPPKLSARGKGRVIEWLQLKNDARHPPLLLLARAGGDRVTRFLLRCMGPVLALKRPSTPTPEGLLTEVLRTKNARAGFVSP